MSIKSVICFFKGHKWFINENRFEMGCEDVFNRTVLYCERCTKLPITPVNINYFGIKNGGADVGLRNNTFQGDVSLSGFGIKNDKREEDN